MRPKSTTTLSVWPLGNPQGAPLGRGRSTAHLARNCIAPVPAMTIGSASAHRRLRRHRTAKASASSKMSPLPLPEERDRTHRTLKICLSGETDERLRAVIEIENAPVGGNHGERGKDQCDTVPIDRSRSGFVFTGTTRALPRLCGA